MAIIFRKQIGAKDKFFLQIRDDPYFESDRNNIEEMWKNFSPYADQNFLAEIPNNFISRFWEMYVGCAMIEAGMILKNHGYGPDLHVFHDNHLCAYIEVTAPGRGTTSDQVSCPQVASFWIPHDNIILRLGSKILDKNKKHQDDIKNKTLDSKVPFIIALNPRRINVAQYRPELPIIRLLYGVDNTFIERDTISPNGPEAATSGWISLSVIPKKSSGTKIGTGLFMEKEFCDVAAILFGCVPVGSVAKKPLNELMLLHNPNAKHPLPKQWIPVATEAFGTNGNIKIIQNK